MPHGTVLGPLLSLAYMNNLHEAAVHSDSRLFSDECLVYRDVDAKRLQDDLDTLEKMGEVMTDAVTPRKVPGYLDQSTQTL